MVKKLKKLAMVMLKKYYNICRQQRIGHIIYIHLYNPFIYTFILH